MPSADYQEMPPTQLAEAISSGYYAPGGGVNPAPVRAAYERFAGVRRIFEEAPHNRPEDIEAPDGHGLTADVVSWMVRVLRESLPLITASFVETLPMLSSETIDPRDLRGVEFQARMHVIRPMMDQVTSQAGKASADSPEGVAYRAMIEHPEEFGRGLAYVVFGANAGFQEFQVFHRAGADDRLNALAEGLGFTGMAELHHHEHGWHLVINQGK